MIVPHFKQGANMKRQFLFIIALFVFPLAALSQEMAVIEARIKPLLAEIQNDWMKLQEGKEDSVTATVVFRCTVNQEGNVEKVEFLKNVHFSNN
jgi:hypothetical protein